LQWSGCESNPQPLGYESDTLPTGPLHPRVSASFQIFCMDGGIAAGRIAPE